MDKSMRSLLYNPYQTVLFTPLSIRRGAGGEAVEGLGVRLVGSRGEAFFLSFPCPFNLFFLPLPP